ncbi:MAG: SH3 domain-containing protein [Oscillospiraceae bacterium]|nr:SH3 domain-containing protein [Oscillospiraceae bacterium]
MHDLSEQERQDMIQRAKGGDPQANYELALWALDQAEAEPEEERWNRLAAKCLVKAAQAGYAPAVEHTAHLLHQTEAGAEAAPDANAPAHSQNDAPAKPRQTAPRPAEQEEDSAGDFDWDGYQQPERERSSGEAAPGAAAKAAAVIGMAGRGLQKTFQRLGAGKNGQETEETGSGSRRAKTGGGGAKGLFSRWGDSKWKRVEIICIAVCVLLALLITIMIITGRKNKAAEEDAVVPTPAIVEQEEEDTQEEAATSDYPSEEIKDEIANATLSTYPEEEDYVTEETTATVNTSSGLNLRRGPGSSYGQIILMENGSKLEVYAYKNGWALVLYDGDTWGWCSTDYIS